MKRFFDFIVALTLIIILSPLLLMLVIIIFLKLGRPIFFFQNRLGFRHQPFRVIKFRTMLMEIDHSGNLLSDQDRLTKFGVLLRSTSLDELPQLFNVLLGEMSLVGPRPLLPEYYDLYSLEEKKRHDVRPGITGWAQVNGRNAITWKDKFAMDIWYVENQTFLLDLKILIKTIRIVLFRKDLSSKGSVTCVKFTGDN